MITRRRFLLASAVGALAPPFAFAQARPVKIGMLAPRPLMESYFAPIVVQRLGELGYKDGAGAILEYRNTDGHRDRYARFARELIELKCDIVITIGQEAAVHAVHAAGARMPVIFLALEYDPLEAGVVKSLARPDGNTTGVYTSQAQLSAKRLQLLHEVLPAARRFLVFSDSGSMGQLSAVRKAAGTMAVQLTDIEFSKPPYDYAAAFEAGRKAKVDGYVGLSSAGFASGEKEIAAQLAKHRLPGIGSTLRVTDSGYLVSMTADPIRVSRRVGDMAARILKGARPADIPVEQADEFELVIFTKTARALGIKVPESLLARATRIVS
jgi:putative ABC transport system substrate-binding protein